MKEQSYIIDASVIIGLLLFGDEKQKIIARFIKNNFGRLYTHELFRYEIANVLKNEIGDFNEVQKLLNEINKLDLKVLTLDDYIIEKSITMALKVNDSVYDASYHALAISREMIFVTLDEKYYKKAQALGSIKLLV